MTDTAELVKLADEIERKRSAYLDAMETGTSTMIVAAKRALEEVLWDDKGTFAPALRLAAQQDGVWQSIETAPRDERRILATGGGLNETIEIVSYNERIGCWTAESCTLDDRDDEAEGYCRPTHWQPLPRGPEQ